MELLQGCQDPGLFARAVCTYQRQIIHRPLFRFPPTSSKPLLPRQRAATLGHAAMEGILSGERAHWQEAAERGMRGMARRRGIWQSWSHKIQQKVNWFLAGQLLEQGKGHIQLLEAPQIPHSRTQDNHKSGWHSGYTVEQASWLSGERNLGIKWEGGTAGNQGTSSWLGKLDAFGS